MKHLLTGGEQVVGDDPPVAPPPHRFGAHYGAALGCAQPAQMIKRATEALAHGIVGIVVKTLVRPKRVHLRRYLAHATAQPPERGHVLILYAMRPQGIRE